MSEFEVEEAGTELNAEQKNGEEILSRLIDGEGFDSDFRETPPRK
jgi:hypothetical protein